MTMPFHNESDLKINDLKKEFNKLLEMKVNARSFK